jgi:hypothetical protein
MTNIDEDGNGLINDDEFYMDGSACQEWGDGG